MPMGLGKEASQMTLAELKAQAARVFAEECARYRVATFHFDGKDKPIFWIKDTGEEIDVPEDQRENWITMRGLEAMWRFMVDSWAQCDEISCFTTSISNQAALENILITLGRQEG
jgi:hypothetical protein